MAASNRTTAFTEVLYAVAATGDRWFVPTTGYGDNADSGTEAQQLAQCQLMSPEGKEIIGQ
jgi:hypothetical protein